MLSGGTIGAGVIACAETATDKAKPAIAINLIILATPKPSDRSDLSGGGWPGFRVQVMPCKLYGLVARRLAIDQ
jgi:hypothetical protein